MGWFSQGKEMLALICSRNHIREFLPPFQWAPSPMFFPASTVNYSWTVLGHSVTKAEKAKKMCWIASYIVFFIIHHKILSSMWTKSWLLEHSSELVLVLCPYVKPTWGIKAPHIGSRTQQAQRWHLKYCIPESLLVEQAVTRGRPAPWLAAFPFQLEVGSCLICTWV